MIRDSNWFNNSNPFSNYEVISKFVIQLHQLTNSKLNLALYDFVKYK